MDLSIMFWSKPTFRTKMDLNPVIYRQISDQIFQKLDIGRLGTTIDDFWQIFQDLLNLKSIFIAEDT